MCAMPQDPQSLAGWIKTTPVKLPTDSVDKFKRLVISGNLSAEVHQAYKYVQSLPAMVPAGITVAARNFVDVQKLIGDNPEGIMFSGSLSQLSVEDRALSTIDYGRIGFIIESAATDAQLKSLMGVIMVNIAEGVKEASNLLRANKDAEVDALCLIMSWNSRNEQILKRLTAIAADLVFLGRRLGAGSKVFAAKFDLMNMSADEHC